MTRIAYLSPLPPERTGIADYSAWLLPELARRVTVDVYAPGRPEAPPGVRVVTPSRRAMTRLGSYDAVVAHVGNSDAHAWIVDALQQVRATVVLHELVLHHLVAGMTLGRGDTDGYLDAMTREAGAVGRLLAHAVIDRMASPIWDAAPELYPLTDVALRNAAGCIAHSHFVADRVTARYPDLPVQVIPLLCPDVREEPVQRAEGPTFGVFGFVTPQKRLDVVMTAFARVCGDIPGSRLLVVGAAPPALDPRATAERAGLDAGRVEVVGYASPGGFERLLRSVDVGVNLRHPTLGETSATVVRWLGAGVPVVVSTGGWYDELPDDAVARVAPGPSEVDDLAATLLALGADRERRTELGEAGRAYARAELAPGRIAERYVRALVGRPSLPPEALRSVAAGMREVATPELARATGLTARVASAARDIGVL